MAELKLKEDSATKEAEDENKLKFSSDVTELDSALFWINLSA